MKVEEITSNTLASFLEYLQSLVHAYSGIKVDLKNVGHLFSITGNTYIECVKMCSFVFPSNKNWVMKNHWDYYVLGSSIIHYASDGFKMSLFEAKELRDYCSEFVSRSDFADSVKKSYGVVSLISPGAVSSTISVIHGYLRKCEASLISANISSSPMI